MGIKVKVLVKNIVIVEIPVEKFEDISFENMSQSESDEMINDAIFEKYGYTAHDIRVLNEVK